MDKILAGRSVLVVEDEMVILMMLEDMLADLGCTSVVTAASVAQALAEIELHVFDAAMLDSNLGGISSDAVADALAERGVPFFFATGQKKRGASDPHPDRPVLKKPFRIEALRESFRQLLQPEGE